MDFRDYQKGLYVCYTKGMGPVELSSHFVRVHSVMAVFTVAQSMVKYTMREVKAAALAKQFGDLMDLMSSKEARDEVHHGMIVECPKSSHDLYRETAIWNKSVGDI